MTDHKLEPQQVGAIPKVAPSSSSRAWKRIWSITQFLVSLTITVAFLCYLLFYTSDPPVKETVTERSEPVQIVGSGLIRVDPDSPIKKRLQIVAVRKEIISDPVMTIAGRVAASLRPAHGKGGDFWQFDSAAVLTTYTDWRKAQADIVFAEKQLSSVKKLAEARLHAQQQVVARLEKLVEAGTDTPKDLAAERANLIQVEITGRKDVYEAETAVRVAKRSEAAAAKQLQQAGLDPDLLQTASSDMDLLMADVPEGHLSRVKVGQHCQATFFGITGKYFTGKVASIAPVLSQERRSLRVLVIVNDPKDELRPGMFAALGLGTDPRDTLLIPADGLLHIDRSDYVLAFSQANTWLVTEVQVGESRNGEVEILSGLAAGQQIVGKGAILFKPLIVHSLQAAPDKLKATP